MSKQPYYLPIGTPVRIRPVMLESIEHHNKTGTLVQIDEHAEDGDAFGVKFEEEPTRVVFFWRRELEVIGEGQSMSDNTKDAANAAYQRIVSKYGVQPLKGYTMALQRNPRSHPCDRCQRMASIATVTAARTQDHYCEQCLIASIEALIQVSRLLGR